MLLAAALILGINGSVAVQDGISHTQALARARAGPLLRALLHDADVPQTVIALAADGTALRTITFR